MQFAGRRVFPLAQRHARLMMRQLPRHFASQDKEGGRLVPYVVLGLSRHATLPQIRARYLELVRKVHPDGGDPGASAQAMAEVSNAYHALTGRKNDDTASDSRISAMLNGVDDVAELDDDGIHQVFAVAVLLDELLDTGCDSPLAPDRASDDASSTNVNSSGSSSNNNTSNSDTTSTALAGSGKLGGVPVRAHASTLDSVADLKRSLEAQWSDVWGLTGRRRTSEKLAIGWEVVHGNTVLGDWFFLGDYGVKSGDILHVVVRKE